MSQNNPFIDLIIWIVIIVAGVFIISSWITSDTSSSGYGNPQQSWQEY